MKDAYNYYIEPLENFDQVIAWESPVLGTGVGIIPLTDQSR